MVRRKTSINTVGPIHLGETKPLHSSHVLSINPHIVNPISRIGDNSENLGPTHSDTDPS